MARRAVGGWAAVVLIAVGAAVAQAFGRFTVGIVLPDVRNDLGLSNTIGGTLLTVNVAAYLIGTIAVAQWTNRVRLITVLKVGLVFSVTGLLVAGTALSAPELAIGLFLTGIGGAFIWIPSPAIAADAIDPKHRRLAIGLMGSGIGAGIIFSGQLATLVASVWGNDAWRRVFVIQTVIGLTVLVITLLFLEHQQDKPTGHRSGVGGFTALKRMSGWRALTVAYTAFGFSYILVIGFITSRLRLDSGWTESRSNLVFTIIGVSIVFGGPLMVSAAGRFSTRLVLTGSFVGWSALALILLSGALVPTFLAAIGIGLMFSGIPSVITAYVVDNTAVEDYGPSYGAATLAFGIAQLISPQIGGAIADWSGSFTLVFLLSSGLALVGAAAGSRVLADVR